MIFLDAVYLVVGEAETSALGEGNDEILEACNIVKEFARYLPSDFENDQTPNAKRLTEYTDFCNDLQKMEDFRKLSKEDFLNAYSYVREVEYNLTRIRVRDSK
jgi:hypothetical protein